MTVIGYHASHEQFPPGMLLSAVRLAESVGFDAAMCSDHLAPWTRAQGESGYAWSWIGAALARTAFPIGLVTAPGQRYHPVIAAQAMATLEEMFPGRFWAALGSGEALNEHVTGDAWPDKDARERRLRDCVAVIRRLLTGDRISFEGSIRVHDAQIWSLPASPPPLFGAAVSPDTAEWVAEWADGLITVGSDAAATQKVRASYRAAGGTGDTALQVHISLEATDEEALQAAREQWQHATSPPESMWDLEQPEQFEELAEPTEEGLRKAVIIAHSAEDLAERVAQAAAGFDRIYLHHVGTDQAAFLRRCETELLPALRSRI
ncbi:MAG: TIGR03885 family FMN-dependent LLM class oxidoreductase [Microbacterium sp.]|uniref:TIGR03885 family FMN-dependent LLM class oxidoreductase n=1 Tax=Microbacterium sp. TaxID=51671 RepID=UPI003BAE715B